MVGVAVSEGVGLLNSVGEGAGVSEGEGLDVLVGKVVSLTVTCVQAETNIPTNPTSKKPIIHRLRMLRLYQ